MAKFVDVYDKTTGRKHRVPEHFLDNPVLSRPFRKTPKTRDTETTSATPETDAITSTASGTNETPAAGDKE